MSENVQDGLAMPKSLSTYIQMFKPLNIDLSIDVLVPMSENEEIHGPVAFDEKHELLVNSIRQFGQVNPIIIYRPVDGTYSIINGVRTHIAAKAAGLTSISCVILDVDKERAFEIMQILNSGTRRVTYAMKAKKLEMLEAHAKKYLKEAKQDGNEASDLTVRQYQGDVLQMCERNVSKFRSIIAHPEREILIDNMDKGFMSLHKAAAIACNKTAKVPTQKGNIPLGKRDELACDDCPRRNKFTSKIDNYEEKAQVNSGRKEVYND